MMELRGPMVMKEIMVEPEKTMSADDINDSYYKPTKLKKNREIKTKLFVFFSNKITATHDLKVFDFKSEMDQWLDGDNSVEIICIIRGVIKEFTVQTKVILA